MFWKICVVAFIAIISAAECVEMTANPPYADMQAQAYCTARGDNAAVVYAVRKDWTRTCEQICISEELAAQDPHIASKGWTGSCLGAIKIYSTFTEDVINREGGDIGSRLSDPNWINKLYLKAFRSLSCINKDAAFTEKNQDGAGPNFCCCAFN